MCRMSPINKFPFGRTPSISHMVVTAVNWAARDLFLAQRFARHASPLTTTVYTHPSDEEMSSRIREVLC